MTLEEHKVTQLKAQSKVAREKRAEEKEAKLLADMDDYWAKK